MRGAALGDVRPGDLAIAAAVAIAALAATVLALQAAHLRRRADAPIIDPGTATPIRVRPVLDLAAPGATPGGAGEAGLPPAWARPEPSTPPAEATPAEAAKQPRRRRQPAKDAGPQAPDPTPPPEGAATTGEAAAAAGGGTGEGEGEGDTEGGAGGDPLAARAIAAYRERLIRWFSARFQVRGSGLPRADLERMRVRAEVEVGESGVVFAYTILAADHPALEAAARVALDAAIGEALPPPPEFYPGAIQRRLRITFVCTETTCD